MKISRGRVPPGGWHYVQDGVTITGATEELLVKAMFEYRMRVGKPIGDLTRDIDVYYCSKWPELCHKEPHEYVTGAAEPVSDEPMLNRVTRWGSFLARTMPRGGMVCVDTDEATRRAAICAGCPLNKAWRTGCYGCSSATASLLSNVRNMRKLACDGQLFGCTATGWDNATAVHFEKNEVQEDQRKHMPEKCWAR